MDLYDPNFMHKIHTFAETSVAENYVPVVVQLREALDEVLKDRKK